MNIPALRSIRLALIGAVVLFLAAVPLLAQAQLDMPTSSVTFPTSTVTQPDEPAVAPEPPPEGSPPPLFSTRTQYPYSDTRFDPAVTRVLYAAASVLILSGILMLGEAASRPLRPFLPRRISSTRRG